MFCTDDELMLYGSSKLKYSPAQERKSSPKPLHPLGVDHPLAGNDREKELEIKVETGIIQRDAIINDDSLSFALE